MSKSKFTARQLCACGLLVAISVVLARLLGYAPVPSQRYSLETLPIFLSGLLFGPVAGALVGFLSDLLGCLLSPYGYNPLLCLPPILLGLWAGLWQKRLDPQPKLLQLLLALLPPMLFGYILLQSAALAWVYHRESFAPFFASNLLARGIQYAIITVVDLLLAKLIYPVLRRKL